MARGISNKKKPGNGPGPGTSPTTNGGSILSFFQRSPADRRTSASLDQVKFERAPSLDRKGKGRAIGGSEADPVIISDDDEGGPGDESRIKRHGQGHAGRADQSSPMDSRVEVIEIDSSPGPSTSPHQSCSPPPAPPVDPPEPAPPISPPPPIAAAPGWRPPKTWPDIVNTSNLSEVGDDEDVDHAEDDGSDGDDDDSLVGREDGHEETEETTMADEDNEVVDSGENPIEDGDQAADSEFEILEQEPIDIDLGDERQASTTPVPRSRAREDETEDEAADALGALDLEMEWDEGDDEGMGMEEEGDDLPEVTLRPASKRDRNEKVTECPVCGVSLRGKVNTVVQHHINTCLDTGTSSRRLTTRRPVTSFASSFSPAPSPSPPPEETKGGPNAFSVLMSGHKEKEQWKDAEIDLKRDGKRFAGRRKAPFYKVLTGMPVAVDAFRYGAIPKVTAYLLTHAHSDHYTNLSKSWNHGPIYCSETTANLIVHMLGVEPQWVHGLPDNVPFEMPNTGGVTVTPIEANHCPGSSIFLFEGPQTVNAGDSGFASPYVGSKRVFRYLHCGDFRACPKMVLHPAISRARIDTCYLDTTYLNPKYCFPPQPQVIDACASLARKTCVGLPDHAPPIPDLKPKVIKLAPGKEGEVEIKPDVAMQELEMEARGKQMMQGWLVKKEEEGVKEEEGQESGGAGSAGSAGRSEEVKKKGRTLVVMGTYSIGKERIVKAVAKAIGSKIYCDPRKRGILLCQTDNELHDLLSDNPVECQVHLLPLGNIQLDRLQPYLHRLHPHFDRVLGFRPTGWTYTPPAGTDLLPDVNTVIKRDQARWFSESSLKPMRGSCREYMMYGVPYSEHSSFFELTCFALSMPGPELKMIATVNVHNEKSRAKMKKWFEKWTAEKIKRKEKGLPPVVDHRDVDYW